MNILIGYYTKTGTTARCAALLREQFHNHTLTVSDLSTSQPELAAFDAILLGAPIRMGHFDKRYRRYLKANVEVLLQKRLGLFACCGAAELVPEVMEKDIPAELLAAAVATEAFGGELIVKNQRGLFHKILVFFMRRSIKNAELDDDLCDSGSIGYPEILPDHISRFADTIKRM